MVFDSEEYTLFWNMIIFATDDEVLLERTQRHRWRTLMVRYHVFEFTDVRHCVALIVRFDTRGIRAPRRLKMVPVSEPIAAEWELERPDMVLMISQAARIDTNPHAKSLPGGAGVPRRPSVL